jgi:hypothetical protein
MILDKPMLDKLRNEILQIVRDKKINNPENLADYMKTHLNKQDILEKYQLHSSEEYGKYVVKQLNERGYGHIFKDYDRLKIHRGCRIKRWGFWMFQANCDTWGGNSGGPVVAGNTLVGVNIWGEHSFDYVRDDNESSGILAERFYDSIERAHKSLQEPIGPPRPPEIKPKTPESPIAHTDCKDVTYPLSVENNTSQKCHDFCAKRYDKTVCALYSITISHDRNICVCNLRPL